MNQQVPQLSAVLSNAKRRPRIAFLDVLKSQETSFLRDVIARLEPDYDIRFLNTRQEAAMLEAIGWADIVWFEWCLEHAVWATNRLKMREQGKKVIVRLHSTEVIDGRCPHRVNWAAVDHLIFVSEDIRDELLKQKPDLLHHVRHSVISNGIDCERFVPGTTAGDPTRIGWVGDVAMKKNPMLALQILRRLVDVDANYHLHLAGEVICPRTARYLDHLVGVMGLADSISFYGRIANIDEWYRDKGVLLSTTLYESFGMNIGEAMASGCWPVVHHYPGAEKTWPTECLFATVEQAVERILQAKPNGYRSFALERYSLDRQEQSIRRLLGEGSLATFDAHSYWRERHASLQGSIRAVGHIGLSESENEQDYATNADHLRAALLAKFPSPEGHVLFDAGCGIGMVSAFCAGLGFDVIGVDFSDVAIAQAKRRVPGGTFITGAFDRVSVPSVDVVICLDVLFHILDDAAWADGIESLVKRLKPGGRLLILEHFPATTSGVQHVRWRSLDAYRKIAAAFGMTLSQVDTYRLPHLNADKSLLVLDKAAAPATVPLSSADRKTAMMIAS